MTVQELNREQLTILKQGHLLQNLDAVSYGELADVDSIISDNFIFEEYGGYTFTEDDFL